MASFIISLIDFSTLSTELILLGLHAHYCYELPPYCGVGAGDPWRQLGTVPHYSSEHKANPVIGAQCHCTSNAPVVPSDIVVLMLSAASVRARLPATCFRKY